jgi:hypothetical protein
MRDQESFAQISDSDFKQPIHLNHHYDRKEAMHLAKQRKKKWIAS